MSVFGLTRYGPDGDSEVTFDLSFVTDNHNLADQVCREEEVAEVHKGPDGQEGRGRGGAVEINN